MNGSALTLTEGTTDSRGEVRFPGLRPGNYRLRITGIGIEDITTDIFTLERRQGYALQMISVKKIEDKNAAAAPPEGPISALALNVPPKASKELDKGKDALEHGKSDEAMKRFSKAAELYPHYAEAFDLIGVAASKNGQSGKEYFEKAITADDQYFPAYTHLAKAHITDKDFAAAEKLLTRSTSLNPRSAEDLFLLAFCQLQQKRFDDAILTAERAHQLEHSQFALVHFVEGEAYAHKGMRDAAIEQYSLYLKEAPLGPSAESAKRMIKKLQGAAD
jgi:tetratricopeptide (TPR) repeat protein